MAAAPLLVPPTRGHRPRAFSQRGLDERLHALARARAPLRRAMLALVGRLVERGGAERLGFARLGDYGAERLGLSARSLQDFAYVERALAELPQLERAFVRGELAWTKVRLLARVATPGDEVRWIERAQARSVRALEREVRRVDVGALENGGAETDPDPEGENSADAKVGVRIRCSPGVRARWWRVRQLANRVAGERVPVWVAMEQVAAEVASTLPLDALADDGGAFSAAVASASQRRLRRTAANACALQAPPSVLSELPLLVRSLVEGLEGADAFELDARLRRAVAQEQQLDAELSPLLLAVAEGRHPRRWGYRDFAGYVRERLGMSPRKARALLRLERAGKHCPALMRGYREGRLSWVQAHALVPVALLGGAPCDAWIRWAGRVSVRRLEDEVGAALAHFELGLPQFPEPPTLTLPTLESPDATARDCGAVRAPGTTSANGAVGAIDGADLNSGFDGAGGSGATDASGADGSGLDGDCGDAQARVQTCAPPKGSAAKPEETARPFFTAPPAVARFFGAVLCSTRRHLERRTGKLPTEGEAFGWMLDHALAVWVEAWETGDPEARRMKRTHAVFARDGWRCTVPGCTSYRNLHDHHIRFRSAGGSNELWNRTTLCAHHHQRGVHAGLVRCSGRAPEGLRFELGLRKGRPPLMAFRSGDIEI